MSAMHPWRGLIGLALMGGLSAYAQIEPRTIPMALEARFDPVHIEGGERLGLLSTALLFEASPDWCLGPVVVGAATGHRGGFFVLGGQIERRWRVGEQWRAQLSLMAGGGGGAGAPVGGGLMLQPAASLLYDWGPVQTGLSWSRVNVPSGRIGSSQFGLIVNWDGRFAYFDPVLIGTASGADASTGLGFDRLMLTTDLLRSTSMRLAGVRAEHRVSPHAYWGVEAAAATHGGADGYMELLGSVEWDATASMLGLNSLYVGARAALGMGGGGAVPTGGGAMGKVAGVLRWDLGPDVFVGFETGQVRAAGGAYRAHYTQWQLGLQLDHSGRTELGRVVGVDWVASLQHVPSAARKTGTAKALDTMGIKVRRSIWGPVYVTGQAHSAFAGGAGAYSLGLAGMGWRSSGLQADWSVGAELLAGAAGGGGVATQGGAVAQALLYVSQRVGRGQAVQFGLGRVRSQQGGLNSPVLDISWSQTFGLGPR